MNTNRTKNPSFHPSYRKEWMLVGLLAGVAAGLILLPKDLVMGGFLLLVVTVSALVISIALSRLIQQTDTRLSLTAARWDTAARLKLGRHLARVALLLAVLATVAVLPGAPDISLAVGLGLWATAGLTLVTGLWLWPRPLPVFKKADLAPRTHPQTIRWPLLIGAALALVLLAEINTGRFRYLIALTVSFHVQMALLVAGCSFVVLTFRGIRRPAATTRRDLWPLVALTLLAFALNTWQLDGAVHTFIDEFHSVHAVDRLWQNPNYRLLRPFDGVPAFTAVYTYVQMIGMTILGPNLAGLRLTSVALGTLLVPAIYLLARELFDRKTALLAALLLATFPPFIHFSRMGINNIADPLVGVLALAFLVRGLKYGHLGDYALSGVMLGLTQYFYEGGKLLYPPLILGWLVLMIGLWRPWGQWRGWLVLFTAFLMIAFPTFYLSVLGGISFTPRLEAVNAFRNYFAPLTGSGLVAFIGERYLVHLLHFFNRPDNSGFFYSNQVGLVLGHLVPFFMLGVGVALARLRLVGVLLILWLLGTIFGNSLVTFASSTPRFVVAFPLVALLLAAGIRHVFPLIVPENSSRWWSRPRWRVMALVAAVAYIGVPSVIFYFGPNMVAYNDLLRSLNKDIGDVFYRLRDLPPDTQIYILHQGDQMVYTNRVVDFDVWWGGLPDFHMEQMNAESRNLLLELPLHTNLAIFLDPDDTASIAMLSERFGTLPQPQYSPYASVPPDRQYALFFIEADGLGRGLLADRQDE